MKSEHWIQRTHLFREDDYVCSFCKASCNKPYKVCPVCGMTMKSAKYDPSWVDEAERFSFILDEDW